MPLNPYLTFDGDCEAALRHYADIFGTEVTMLQRLGAMPDTSMVPKGAEHRIAHGRVAIADGTLMASDTMGQPHEGFHGFTLQVEAAHVDEGRALFDRLAGGGEVSMPFEPTFWAAGFGMCRDKFGVPWMVNVEAAPD